MKTALALVLSAFLGAAPALAGTITVDDDQPADFTTIGDAILAASPGDVILVSPGTYPGFVLDKSLSILGPAIGARPVVTGPVTVNGAGSFQLASFELQRLEIDNVLGRGAVDDSRMFATGDRVLEISGCTQIVVTRCEIQGQDSSSGGAAAKVTGSTVEFTDCTLIGASGLTPDAGDGADGLRAIGANVMLAGCDVQGGDGGKGGFSMIYGDGGDGVHASGSTVVLRGNGNTLGAGSSLDPSGLGDGAHISAPNSTVVYSGMHLLGTPSVGAATLVTPDPPEPFLTIGGSDVPGEARRLFLHGPNGAAAFVVVSLLPASLSVPAIEGTVWVAPAGIVQIVPLVTAGQSAPKTYLLPVPPSLVGLEGLALQVQAAFPLLAGAIDPSKSVVTNPANAILRFVHVEDCNGNLVDDAIDIATGTSFDCNGDGIPDECEDDCNGNGLDDSCDIAAGTSLDCNGNGVPDECEGAEYVFRSAQLGPLGSGSFDVSLSGAPHADGPVTYSVAASGDLDDLGEWIEVYMGSGLSSYLVGKLFDGPGEGGHCSTPPDVAEATISAYQFNKKLEAGGGSLIFHNNVPSAVSAAECPGSFLQVTIRYPANTDCNGNGIPDDCDIASGLSTDLNGDAIPDECLSEGDCNGNGVSDVLDIASGVSADVNGNWVPDECLVEGDCNGNGVSDLSDIASGTSIDCNGNLRPDECEVGPAYVVTYFPTSPLDDTLVELSPAPHAVGDLTLSTAASGDLDTGILFVYLKAGGSESLAGKLYADPGEGGLCAVVPDLDSITIPAAGVNSFIDLAGGKLQLQIYTEGSSVDACLDSFLQVTLSYAADVDCNANGIPDECDIAAGTSLDANHDGIPDECQP